MKLSTPTANSKNSSNDQSKCKHRNLCDFLKQTSVDLPWQGPI